MGQHWKEEPEPGSPKRSCLRAEQLESEEVSATDPSVTQVWIDISALL